MTTYNFNGVQIDTNNLTVDDMPTEIFQEIFDLCGVEVAVSLLYFMVGNTIQVPTNGMEKIVKKMILQDYDGTTASIRAISRKLRISESLIRDTLRKNKITPPSPGQRSIVFSYD